MPLEPRTVRAFYAEYLALLRDLGIEVRLWPVPVEVPDPIPRPRTRSTESSTTSRPLRSFWEVLRRSDAALTSSLESRARRVAER
nr:DUF5996 family protein [Anaeromyxobacter sp. Fw109-5]